MFSKIISCGIYPIFMLFPSLILLFSFSISFIRVDFPTPFSPTRHSFSWYFIFRFRSLNISLVLYDKFRLFIVKTSFPERLPCSKLIFIFVVSVGLSFLSIFYKLFWILAALRKNISPPDGPHRFPYSFSLLMLSSIFFIYFCCSL